jgi:hypothetical protein
MYDEVDELHYRTLKDGDVDNDSDGLKSGTIDFTKDNHYPVSENSRRIISFMNKNQTEETVICTYSPIYLMNNNGKTLEII